MSDDHLNDEEPGLGKRLEVFRPSLGNVIAGFILSIAGVAGGLALFFFAGASAVRVANNLPMNNGDPPNWFLPVFVACVASFFIALGIYLGVFVRGLMSSRVEYFENGFVFHERRTADVVLWSDVQKITETILYERVMNGPVSHLLPKVASTSYTLTMTSGAEHGFNVNSVPDITDIEKILRPVAGEYSLPWETVEQHS